MTPPNLHTLPTGSVIASGSDVALRGIDQPRPWFLTGPRPGPYTAGDLLMISQDWTVLRYGPDHPGPPAPTPYPCRLVRCGACLSRVMTLPNATLPPHRRAGDSTAPCAGEATTDYTLLP